MNTTTSNTELISREDAALLTGCSVDTIKRVVISENLTTTTGLRGKVMVQMADLVRLERISAPAASAGGSGADSAALVRTQMLGPITRPCGNASTNRLLWAAHRAYGG